MIAPTISDFKNYFYRDFPYSASNLDLTKVTENDISKAIGQAAFNINQDLFDTQENYQTAYLYLTAHYLVIDLRMASQGVAGSYSWLQSSKSVGSVSQGFTIPDHILKNPLFALLSTTQYGAKYLSIVLPLLTGTIFDVGGKTLA